MRLRIPALRASLHFSLELAAFVLDMPGVPAVVAPLLRLAVAVRFPFGLALGLVLGLVRRPSA